MAVYHGAGADEVEHNVTGDLYNDEDSDSDL